MSFLGLMALAFVALRLRSRLLKPVAAWELFACLQLDVLALAMLLYFGGGASNPFVSILLLPDRESAALLPVGYVWAMAGVTVAVYTALMFRYLPLPGMLSGHGPGFHAHLWGMWLVFVISALLVAGFVAGWRRRCAIGIVRWPACGKKRCATSRFWFWACSGPARPTS